MGRIAYLDCFAGASGDMILGALVDAGAPLASLRAELAKLPLSGYRPEAARVRRAGLAATQVVVTVEEPQPPCTLREVTAIINGSGLPAADRERALAVFRRLAAAEAKVHGLPVEEVHLHDVGAVDAIVDVVGAVVGLRLLDVEELYASQLPVAGGSVASRHMATLPLPAPATLEVLAQAGAPVISDGPASGELVTPTGAAIVATLARFQRPAMALQAVGYGAGSRDPSGYPNVLRLWLGEAAAAPAPSLRLLETNIDDTTPEVLGYVLERLLAVGTLDAWFTPIQMKKGRPAVTLSALCSAEAEAAVVGEMLRETSTLGVRVHAVGRHEAERETVSFQSSLGPAAVKVKHLPGRPPQPAPEYEVCRRIAQERGLPLMEVYRVVQAEAEEFLRRRGGAEGVI
ncbi:MAG: nickel pincer cofactor biosynthesis protein LarC [Dehalococcoidia bacterium]